MFSCRRCMIADVFYIRLLAISRARYATYWKGLAYDTGRRGHPVSSKWIYVKGSKVCGSGSGWNAVVCVCERDAVAEQDADACPWKKVGGY
jgi:hypothetical protein